MKRITTLLLLAGFVLVAGAQVKLAKKVDVEKMLNRFVSYAKIESASEDEPDMNSFPLKEGQKVIARYVYDELKTIVTKDIKLTLSDDYYIYVDIPSNVKQKVPSMLFMAHLDVTPDAPGSGIKPTVHRNYDGGIIQLNDTMILDPAMPRGAHLKELKGKTIVTSDGTTLLGADDKTGCAVLVSLVEEIVNNPKFKHGRVMLVFSQNEDVGKAALRYDPTVFGDKPDIVLDVDGDTHNLFSVANFTAEGQSYLFKGNEVHPSQGKAMKLADALTAAAYFIGQVPPELSPAARDGAEGYVHCYALFNPITANGDTIKHDYVVKVRLRYFDQAEGAGQRQLMAENLAKTQKAFPNVEIIKTDDAKQYENVAYSMPAFLPDMIKRVAGKMGFELGTRNERAGTTSAMMVARFPDVMPGGACIYSGQQAEHSEYEWCCIEELLQVVDFCENLITEALSLK